LDNNLIKYQLLTEHVRLALLSREGNGSARKAVSTGLATERLTDDAENLSILNVEDVS